MPNRLSIGCQSCACPCAFEAPDGSDYSDDFASLDGGWISAFGLWTYSAAGTLRWTGSAGAFVVDRLYRNTTYAGTLAKALVQADYNRTVTNIQRLGVHLANWALYANWFTNTYATVALGSNISNIGGTPATSATLTLTIEAITGGQVRACYFVDGVLIASDDRTASLPGSPIQNGLWTGMQNSNFGPPEGELDNYSLELQT